MQKPKKLLFTGGHAATTAYTVMQEIINNKKNWDLYWIGAKNTLEGKKVSNFEEELFRNYDVKNYHITAGKLQQKLNLTSLISLIKIPLGFVSAANLVYRIKPDLVFSFGGYVSFPVVVAAKLNNIPVIIQEQTAAAGIANIKAARFASVVVLARESSKKYFPKEKCMVVGNPISPKITKISAKKSLSKIPVILVTGGSRGSQVINKAVFESVDELAKNHKIIHLTGDLDYEKAIDIKKNLNTKRYEIHRSVTPERMAELLKKSDIVISRAGANTVSEIITSSRPAILIPIPWAHYNEQYKNAEYAKKAGIAEIITEDKLTKNTLINKIDYVMKNWKKMSISDSEILKSCKI